jgi:hypothetical protein
MKSTSRLELFVRMSVGWVIRRSFLVPSHIQNTEACKCVPARFDLNDKNQLTA